MASDNRIGHCYRDPSTHAPDPLGLEIANGEFEEALDYCGVLGEVTVSHGQSQDRLTGLISNRRALGFSIGRNYYKLLLNHPESDAGLDSALVTIWLEVELAYAIGSSTLSALKSFTDNFTTGFGLGFTRGKGEDSYGLSNVSGSTGNTSKTEKAKSASPPQSRTDRTTETTPESKKASSDLRVPPKAHTSNVAIDEPLRLRPEGVVAYTSVSAEPYGGDLWRANSSVGSDSSGDEMVILREREYEVQHHDQAPMLPVRESLA